MKVLQINTVFKTGGSTGRIVYDLKCVMDGEGIDPAETLFLDDGQRNVESAAALGIKTYLVENGSDWTKAIFDFLK